MGQVIGACDRALVLLRRYQAGKEASAEVIGVSCLDRRWRGLKAQPMKNLPPNGARRNEAEVLVTDESVGIEVDKDARITRTPYFDPCFVKVPWPSMGF